MNEPVSELKNLGPKSESWLNQIGIFSRADLERIGAVEVYRLLRERDVRVSLNLVYAIEAMLIGVHWTKLPQDLKMELRDQIRKLK